MNNKFVLLSGSSLFGEGTDDFLYSYSRGGLITATATTIDNGGKRLSKFFNDVVDFRKLTITDLGKKIDIRGNKHIRQYFFDTQTKVLKKTKKAVQETLEFAGKAKKISSLGDDTLKLFTKGSKILGKAASILVEPVLNLGINIATDNTDELGNEFLGDTMWAIGEAAAIVLALGIIGLGVTVTAPISIGVTLAVVAVSVALESAGVKDKFRIGQRK